ncbi:hypothetical protein tooticki91_gp018 [Flavobacterium phage vB_FspS_tooticki9-1]|uniref:Uncharacterized protein n=24 Tax=Caudoviricetes TaxID=2731619 RepID=A0A6B9LNX8_9CAUD|nr:hypothetical protein HWC87_gp24 [Flavobacterium phage vB_FspS_filifjonk9-1]YP_009854672.1 hypothetical protein HWC88_gp20 [Flavobacterium phage vB_FspS_hattifnatt9-1]YP_009854751.1 hypothetical protein HWC89_gp23 [Flavobacterium phage vB_FspS_hemulen6-1]YP_009854881.1 hypothetical protein HWC91_gp26 [Flavobacterium phage vB_FspS_lillamy9-1]YP_009855021.1 hypothetical protein HWC93_gp20 [Flavobacterium phage vB_FspS_mumin9-1]YP_009855089.1 hypothetical protein HWC94_gp21 [Flavobacterium phag
MKAIKATVFNLKIFSLSFYIGFQFRKSVFHSLTASSCETLNQLPRLNLYLFSIFI